MKNWDSMNNATGEANFYLITGSCFKAYLLSERTILSQNFCDADINTVLF